MISYRAFVEEDLKEVVKLWNKEADKDGFYKGFTEDGFRAHLLEHPEFASDGTFVACDNKKIVGFVSATVRRIEQHMLERPGYLVAILVESSYRRQGIGKELINMASAFLKSFGKAKMLIGYTSTINWPWYIPNTQKHDHAGAPGVAINSEFYCYLINHGFEVVEEEDAFHADLATYEIPDNVKHKIIKNELNGYKIEIYDPNKHYGLEEFFNNIQSEPFERVIRSNLKLAKPYPFFVVSHQGKIEGWTGAMWTEPSGRAHFDGIIIAPSVRGMGIGQSLFCMLGQYSKEHGSSFMTFFTGRHNPARYIYLGAGFKIIQSFALMQKGI